MIPIWTAIVLVLVALLLGVCIGIWIQKREQQSPPSRIAGPGIPTEEGKADDFYRKEGWL